MARRRPNFNQAVRVLIKDVASRMLEFEHVRASRIVVVAGEARRSSRGTVKPLTFAGMKAQDALGRRKPVVKLNGKRMLYCITLRPLFFRASTPQARVATLLHELFHISASFDGTLDSSRRHDWLGRDFVRKLRPLIRRYLRHCPIEVWAPFAYDGDVRVLHWLERPASLFVPGRGNGRKVYSEEQLFYGVVRMVTPRADRQRLTP